MALKLFDWTQRAAEIWLGSNHAARRQILDAVCLNRTLSDVSLIATKRKPFDAVNIRRSRNVSWAQQGRTQVAGR
jgi:hypothetical protein